MYDHCARECRTRIPLRLFRATLAFACAFACAIADARSAPILAFDFDGADGGFTDQPALLASGLTASGWSDRDGTLTDFAGNPGRAIAASGWNDGNALRFVLTTAANAFLDLEGWSFDQRASASGPLGWRLRIGEILIAAGDTTLAFATMSGASMIRDLNGSFTVELEADGASSAAGTWRIDNFTLSGALRTVPEPATAGLAALALLCFALAGARRARLRIAACPARGARAP
jgi:hypothetical protein